MSLAEAVGGPRVQASAIVPNGADAEAYEPRPHDLARLKTARVVLRVGADYDLWLDRLLDQAANAAIVRGGPGYVDCSFGIALLDVRGAEVGAAGGHAHGNGNPHYWLDPANAERMTDGIVAALKKADPQGANEYDERRRRFLARLAQKLQAWQQILETSRRRPLLAYHNTWAYFARRFRLHFTGTVEVRPGVPPSPSHLAALIASAHAQQVAAIVRQPHESPRTAEFLAARLGVPVLVLAGSVGALPEATDYIALFDYNAATLAAASR